MTSKLVSILILNYNGENFICDLFLSLSKQTFKDFEVIFIDNASTDNSIKVLKSVLGDELKDDLDVKIVVNSKNLGYCRGNNLGLKFAEGKYIIFLNNDTYLSRTWLKELVEIMDAKLHIGACQSRLIYANGKGIQKDGDFLDVYGWPLRVIFRKCGVNVFDSPFYLSGTSLAIRRSVLEEVGSFDPQLFYGDYDLSWRIRLHSYDVATALRSRCYHYSSVATKTLVPMIEQNFHRYRELIRVLLKNYSTKNVLKRMPQSITLMFVEATYILIKKQDLFLLKSLLKALIWNLKMLKDTLVARSRIQKNRKVPDSEIEKSMLKFSVLLAQRGKVEIA